MLVSMLGSFALMLPTSWVYMATRQKKGFDQTMVQTLIILAMAVTGVVVIVRNSLALAFSLAGIVGAVRFRNSLPDTRDTLYVFLAIGVGLASGVEALGAAAVLSVVFNYTVLALSRANYGMCELGKSSRPLLLTHKAAPGGAQEKNGKRADFNGVLVVRTRQAERNDAAAVRVSRPGAQALDPRGNRIVEEGTRPPQVPGAAPEGDHARSSSRTRSSRWAATTSSA